MKKLSSLVSALLVSSMVFLTACSTSTGNVKEGSPSAGNAATGDKVKISFIHWRGEDTKVFNELIAQFEQSNPNIAVQMNVFPSEQYLATAQAKLLDGSTGDVFASFPGAQFESISKAGVYEDLSGEAWVGNFQEDLIKIAQKDGKQLALPYQLVYNQPLYNKAIFEKLGLEPAKDWDGFLQLCEKLKENGYIPIAFPGADIGPGQFINSMMMNNNPDEKVWDKVEAGEAKLTDEWFVKTLSQFKELNDKGYLQKDSLGTKKDGAAALFAQEQAAMLATGSYMMSAAKEKNPNIAMGLLAPITVPADQAVFEGIHTTTFLLGVNAKSKHKDEAKKFIEFLSQPDHAGKYANETGQLVTVKGVEYKTPELEESAKWAEKKTRFQPRFLIQKAEIEKAVVASVQDVIAGTSPEEAAKKSQMIVEQHIKK